MGLHRNPEKHKQQKHLTKNPRTHRNMGRGFLFYYPFQFTPTTDIRTISHKIITIYIPYIHTIIISLLCNIHNNNENKNS